MKLRRLGGVLEVGDEVIPVLLLLQTGEHHLGAGDVLLGVGEVNVKGIGTPGDAYQKKYKIKAYVQLRMNLVHFLLF